MFFKQSLITNTRFSALNDLKNDSNVFREHRTRSIRSYSHIKSKKKKTSDDDVGSEKLKLAKNRSRAKHDRAV